MIRKSFTVAAEPTRNLIYDEFTDNDRTGWEIADLISGSDGSWSASSGVLSCTGTVAVTGAPGGGYASILLIEGADFQDYVATCEVSVTSGTPTVGLVFGYIDETDYWLITYEAGGTTDNVKVYHYSSSSFVLKETRSDDTTGGSFAMAAHVYSGSGAGYTDDIPAGQVGIYSAASSGVSFDDFAVRDKVGPYAVDGRWICSQGYTTIDDSDSNVLEIGGASAQRHTVFKVRILPWRSWFRADSWSSPKWILFGHSADQLANLDVDLWPSRSASRLPSPVELEALLVPPDDRFWLHDDEYGVPIRPEARQPSPEDPITFPEPRPFRALLQDRELLSEGEVLNGQLGAVSNDASNQNKDNPQHAHFIGLQG